MLAIDGVPRDGGAESISASWTRPAPRPASCFRPGRALEQIEGTALTCIDAAPRWVIVRAEDLGEIGQEHLVEFDADRPSCRGSKPSESRPAHAWVWTTSLGW
jgi:2-methylaconitate cis-trans-isomerase PrpF